MENDVSPREVYVALLESRNSSEALARLFRLKKVARKGTSLAQLCKRCGIPSKGYLSDVFSGKKSLHEKYHHALVDALCVDDPSRIFLRAMLQNKTEEIPQERMEALRRALEVKLVPAGDHPDLFFVCHVFSCFDLYGGKASRALLEEHFGESERQRLSDALAALAAWEVIEERDGEIILRENFVLFGERGDRSVGAFLRASCLNAAREAEHWFNRPQDAFINSLVMSVGKADYLRFLQRFKLWLKEEQALLGSINGDTIVHFCVNLYPLSEK